VHGHAMGQLQRNRSAMPRRTQGAVETRYTRLLRATVFAVIGRPQSAKSTPRHRIPAIGQEACDGHLPCCSSLSYICSPRSFAKSTPYSVGSNLQSFRFGISIVRGRAHGPDPDQLLSNARSLFGNPWRLWLQIAC
jgi:hypothetical protein